ncbi:MAG: SGNH/GDSL hydrolase family protein [Planctomycetota bacterium]
MKPAPRKLRSMAAIVRKFWYLLGIALLIFLFVEVGLALAFLAKDLIEGDPEWLRIERGRAFADGYQNAIWPEEFFEEFEESNFTEWHSYVYWRRKAFEGSHIHIDGNGRRRTWNPPAGANPGVRKPYRIFMFGGSTLWGTGVRDDYTLASCLSRTLNEAGLAVEVVNFGESGYVSTQEMITLILELQKGNVPDMVIFYDGVNDVYSAHQNRGVGIPQNEANRIREFNSLKTAKSAANLFDGLMTKTRVYRFVRGVMRRLTGGSDEEEMSGGGKWELLSPDRLAEGILSRYEENIKLIKALGSEKNFRALFYWQPIIFMKDHLTTYESGAVGPEGNEIRGLFLETCERIAASEFLNGSGIFHDLSYFFQSVEEPLFIDWCHVAEKGNEMLADRIAADVRAAFDQG